MELTCLNDENYDHKEGKANQERKGNASKVEAVLAPQHQCSYTQEEDGRGYESQNGRHKPRQKDRHHALHTSNNIQ